MRNSGLLTLRTLTEHLLRTDLIVSYLVAQAMTFICGLECKNTILGGDLLLPYAPVLQIFSSTGVIICKSKVVLNKGGGEVIC